MIVDLISLNLNLNTKLYRPEITKHSAECLKQLKRVALHRSSVPVQKRMLMHYGIMLEIDQFS